MHLSLESFLFLMFPLFHRFLINLIVATNLAQLVDEQKHDYLSLYQYKKVGCFLDQPNSIHNKYADYLFVTYLVLGQKTYLTSILTPSF